MLIEETRRNDKRARAAHPAPHAGAATRRVSVLHLIHTMAYGGVETAVLNWLTNFDSERFDVRVACFANPGATESPFVEAAERRGLRVWRIPWGRRKPIIKAGRALAALLRDQRVDILHTHNWYADFVGALAARLAPVKTITTLYVWFDYDWKRNLLQALDRRVIKRFDLVTAHCEDTRRKTIAGGYPAERLRVLNCGFTALRADLTPAERLSLRREMGVGDDEIVLANIARLYPEKAQASLLRCFKEIHQRAPRTRLWIAGVGPLEAELKRACAALGLDGAVGFLGFVDDLPRLLALVDIQVHPALIEGIPLAICAGMAAGLPIVASAVGGLPEILAGGRCGRLVPGGDENAFVDAVLRLIAAPEEAAQLGHAARQMIETDFSLKAAVRRVEETYLEVIGPCASVSSS